MNPQTRQAIADALEGTSGIYDAGICEQHGIEMEELETIASDFGLERCEACGWWVERDELNAEGECEDCGQLP